LETKKGVKRFTKGINRDISKSLINTESSYFIRNYKLNTDKGLSTGSLISESGNTIMFNVPNIPQMVYAKDSKKPFLGSGVIVNNVPAGNVLTKVNGTVPFT